jgi:hypothetical protein
MRTRCLLHHTLATQPLLIYENIFVKEKKKGDVFFFTGTSSKKMKDNPIVFTLMG